jgi:hypothetical protein
MIVRLSPSGSIFCRHFLQKPRHATFSERGGEGIPPETQDLPGLELAHESRNRALSRAFLRWISTGEIDPFLSQSSFVRSHPLPPHDFLSSAVNC